MVLGSKGRERRSKDNRSNHPYSYQHVVRPSSQVFFEALTFLKGHKHPQCLVFATDSHTEGSDTDVLIVTLGKDKSKFVSVVLPCNLHALRQAAFCLTPFIPEIKADFSCSALRNSQWLLGFIFSLSFSGFLTVNSGDHSTHQLAVQESELYGTFGSQTC